MPRFFLEHVAGDTVTIQGNDGHHIRRSLRMRPGDELTVTDGQQEYACEITAFDENDTVTLRVVETRPILSEPTLKVTLYQALPKGDKMEWIIQKAVELGVTTVVPVATSRSIMKLDAAGAAKKRERWQKIAAEAAGQSGRGIIPTVELPLSFAAAAARMANENTIVFYEGGGKPLSALISPATEQASVFIGPEGGIAPDELAALQEGGAHTATLGKRILRCETAPIAAISILMALSGNCD